MKALIILDMQIGCFKPYSSRYNTERVIKQINLLSNYFRKSGFYVIYIQHDGTKEGMCQRGTYDFELLPELIQTPSDIYVVKEANEAFYKTNLDDILKKKDIDELYFCGLASNFCLDATIKSALSKDYKIYVALDAHTTRDNSFISAQELIEYYNWLWSELTPTKYKVTVCTAREITDNLL